MDRLPKEILLRIFKKHIHREYLKKPLYVCKMWFNLIKPILFEEVYLSTKSLQKLNALMRESAQSGRDLMSVFHPFPFTKILDFEFAYFFKPDHTAFLFLLSLFPALKEIRIDSAYYRQYLDIIDSGDIEQLPRLERISVTNCDYLDESYHDERQFSVYYKFRHSLQYMHLLYEKDAFIKFGKGILDLLADFENLTKIQFNNYFDRNLTALHLLKALPKLQSIIFTSVFPTAHATDAAIKDLLNDIKAKKLTTAEYFKDMRLIKIEQPDFSPSCAEFFAKHCPPNLKEAHFHLENTDFYTWIKDVTLPVALGFAKKMSKVKKTGIVFDEINSSIKVTRDSLNFGRKINDFYQFLKVFKGERSCTLANFDYELSPISSSAKLYNSKHGTEYHYTLNHVDYGIDPADDNNQVAGFIPYHTYTLPTPDYILNDETMLPSTLIFSPPITTFSTFPAVYLDYARKYYKKLASVLVRYRCQHIDDEYSYIKARQKDGVLSTLGNMHSVSITGVEHSQQILDTLHHYIPSLGVLHYSFSDNLPEQNIGQQSIDLSNFKDLQEFILNFDSIANMHYEYIFAQIKRTGSEKMASYILWGDNDDSMFKPTDSEYVRRALVVEVSHLIIIEAPQQLKCARFELDENEGITLSLKNIFDN